MDRETKQMLIDKAKARNPAYETDLRYRPDETAIWNRAVIACLNAVDDHWEKRFKAESDKAFLDGIRSTRRVIDGVAIANSKGKAFPVEADRGRDG
jgi:hypothetical protein